tara:strand:- start:968 stop:1804 length:837 start_codon:yes stop_codon:yes gene_type:complete
MKKYLVTGYKGFIGSKLYNALPVEQTIGIDLKDGHDIIDQLPDEKVDVVFHMAALPSVEYSVKHPSYTLKHNVLGTSKVLEWAKKQGVKRVVFSSSAAVYGDDSGPTSPYGMHKLMSEKECKLYSDLYGLDTVSLRYFNVYSEDQPYGGAYSTVISAWMEMVRQSKPLRIDGDGSQTRDYIYVEDVIEANIFCANYKKNFNGASFDVGSGESVSLVEIKNFIDTIQNVQWAVGPQRPGDILHSEADASGLYNLGWSSKTNILDGLKRCFNISKGENNE